MERIYHLLLLLAQTASSESGETGVATPNSSVEVAGIILCTIGVCLLIVWLFWFGGFRSLKKAPIRRCHRLFPLWAIGFFILWLLMMIVIAIGTDLPMKNASKFTQQDVSYTVQSIMLIGFIGLVLIIVRKFIPRGLKGWGLNPATLGTDTAMATIHLTAVYPLVISGLSLMMWIGKLFNPEFKLQVHESLELLTEAGLGLRILVAVYAVVFVPAFEELMFRGMIQTSVRCFTGSPWAAILITSLFFAMLHPPTHFLAIFMLSCGLGYAYERSGSLFRPILMHTLFNMVNITATLLMS